MWPNLDRHTLAQGRGLLHSLLIYYAIPWRHAQLVRFYRQFVAPGALCFDIGAHVGNRLWAWSQLGAQIVAVEPQPQCMRVLRRLYGGRANILLVEEAVGRCAGVQTLHVSRRTPAVSTLSADWIEAVKRDASFAAVDWDGEVTVPVTTLDALIARCGRPHFCKIDVEGYELEVLAGLTQPLPVLSFEFIPAAAGVAAACLERLAALGEYEFNWTLGEEHRWRSARWLDVRQMGEAVQRERRSGDIYARLKEK